jgi:hypothetical protein
VMLPYGVIVTWLDGKSSTEFQQGPGDIPLDAGKFAKSTRK